MSIHTADAIKNKVMASKEGLTVTAYRGDNNVLLAFNLKESLIKNLAGFAIKLRLPNGKSYWLKNRLSFEKPLQANTSPQERLALWTESNLAPFQRFHWQHFPDEIMRGTYTYSITPMYFNRKGGLIEGVTADIAIDYLPKDCFDNLEIGFTRSYVSSQAYHDLFQNRLIRPLPKTLDYNTTSYQQQYEWLGATAREVVFAFLNEALEDPAITIDALIYDIDEVHFVEKLEKLGSRIRVFFDDSKEHVKEGALEAIVHQRIQKSAGQSNVKKGHFKRFQHNKVLIQKKNNKPIRVLTGSMNFSVRGFYVQANNVLAFDDTHVASLYEQVFQQIWDDENNFSKSEIASKWFSINQAQLPAIEFCFSPHKSGSISLNKIQEALKKAKSSVFFSVMDLQGGGGVLQSLKSMAVERKDLFSYGVTQNLGKDQERQEGVAIYGPGRLNGVLVPFGYLHGQVRPPFNEEVSGGFGQVIHNKFIVIDFNHSHPIVFTGSSNIAEGGEMANGDNLIAISDPVVAILYAVEACRLVDHFRFRAALYKSTSTEPLVLKPDARWCEPYYDPSQLYYKQRLLFSRE